MPPWLSGRTDRGSGGGGCDAISMPCGSAAGVPSHRHSGPKGAAHARLCRAPLLRLWYLPCYVTIDTYQSMATSALFVESWQLPSGATGAGKPPCLYTCTEHLTLPPHLLGMLA
eukprot:scaffold147387_cov19-Tisochrysis_lutea.AAC.2